MSTLWFLIWIITLPQSRTKWVESSSLENGTKFSWTSFTNSSTQKAFESEEKNVLRVYARNVCF